LASRSAVVGWRAWTAIKSTSGFWRERRPARKRHLKQQPLRDCLNGLKRDASASMQIFNGTFKKEYSMSDPHKMTEVSISTKSIEPLTGIVRVNTADAEMKFEITEDIAHKICTDLERFLTR
jgi:hypothetical protein